MFHNDFLPGECEIGGQNYAHIWIAFGEFTHLFCKLDALMHHNDALTVLLRTNLVLFRLNEALNPGLGVKLAALAGQKRSARVCS